MGQWYRFWILLFKFDWGHCPHFRLAFRMRLVCEPVTDPFPYSRCLWFKHLWRSSQRKKRVPESLDSRSHSWLLFPLGQEGLAGRQDPDVGCSLSANPQILPGGRARTFLMVIPLSLGTTLQGLSVCLLHVIHGTYSWLRRIHCANKRVSNLIIKK